jgi:uncharacterized iron-regulated membrane protein
MRPRRLLVRVHRWVALALLAWVAVVSVTGAWLVFNDLFESWLRPERYTSTDGDVGMATAVALVEQAVPADAYLSYSVLPGNACGVYRIDAAWPDPDAPPPVGDELPHEVYATYYVDPGTGEINDRTIYEEGFTWWMYRGHMFLWQDHGIANAFHPTDGWCRPDADGIEPGGPKGMVCDAIPNGDDIVAWLAVAWIVVLLTGFYLWYWPGVRRWATAFAIRRGRGAFAFNMSVHKVVGLVVWVPLLVIAFTGIAFAFPNLKGWYENVTPAGRGAELWVPPEDAVSTPVEGAEPLDIDEVIAILEDTFPERRVHSVFGFPEETGTWQAWVDRGYSPWTREAGSGNTLVVVDQYSGEVLYDGPPSEGNVFVQAWTDWSFPLHTGDFAGTYSRTAWFAIALSPVVLGATGLAMWIVRLRKRRRARRRPAGAGAHDTMSGKPAPELAAVAATGSGAGTPAPPASAPQAG